MLHVYRASCSSGAKPRSSSSSTVVPDAKAAHDVGLPMIGPGPVRFPFSHAVSCGSAAWLAAAGLGLTFAADDLLAALVPGFPPAAAWVGQVLGAAWFGVAALNWLQRRTVLGGIYGRPIVLTNVFLYGVGTLSLIGSASRGGVPLALVGIMATFALAYTALLLRGPFDRLRE